MPISIGIITARQSLENIRSVDRQMKRLCQITYLPYNTWSELRVLYEKNISKFDGILFSGPLPKDYITENIGHIPKPFRCVDLKDRDYYLAAARLLIDHPGLDFSRVYVDAVIEDHIISNMFHGHGEPFYKFRAMPQEYTLILRSAIYEKAMSTYRSLWRKRKYDIFVTRYTNLEERMKRESIPCLVLKPLPETVLDYFQELLSDIKESRLQNSLAACCLIELPENRRSQENCDLLRGLLTLFNENHGSNMLIRKNDFRFEITMTSMEARRLTSGYTTDLLSKELHSRLPFSALIGWGISFDVVTAYKNARQALLACRKDRNSFTYLVTESQEMIGPLDSNRAISYGLQPAAHIMSLAKSLGIAPINLEKIISLQKTRGIYEFTSSDLVYYLEITPRSAARILLKLSEGGFGRPIRCVNLSGTGRPTTVYEIDFDRIRS